MAPAGSARPAQVHSACEVPRTARVTPGKKAVNGFITDQEHLRVGSSAPVLELCLYEHRTH